MPRETFVKWVQDFDANFVCFVAVFGIKMFHLLQTGFLVTTGRNDFYGLFICTL